MARVAQVNGVEDAIALLQGLTPAGRQRIIVKDFRRSSNKDSSRSRPSRFCGAARGA
jgi:hypothetical protein